MSSQKHHILITGAARGIGRDTAFALAARGHRVLATTRTQEQADALQTEATVKGLMLETAKLDITNLEDIQRVIPKDIDVAINNAAISESGPMAEVPIDRVKRLLETNIVGTLQITQQCANAMLQRKEGRIILVSSVAGRVILPHLGPYSMTKFAIEGMGDALRRELLPYNIFVSLIEPGLIYTGFNEQMAQSKYAWLSKDSAFAGEIAAMRKRDATITQNSSPTDSIVRAMIHAVESPHPHARYTRPWQYAAMLKLLTILPEWIKDRVMRHAAGLK